MQLIDEQHDLPVLLGEVVEHRLHPLFELSPVLGARDQRAHVEGEQSFVLEAIGHLTVDDSLGEALHDGGLADPRLTNEHRVVLRAPLEDLHGSAYLIVASDDWIELALLGPLGEIDRVFLECLTRLLRIGIVDPLAAAHSLDRAGERLSGGAVLLQLLAGLPARLESGENEQLAREVLIVALLGELVGKV